MNVIRRQNELVVQIPNDIPFAYLDELISYLNIKSILAKSQATDEDVETLANEITTNWWVNNKDRLLNGDRH
ncbi:MAG: hypothetical protein H7319_16905 [Spirosoma sp.]|nr:hypothetical protein [Spirosoma sp.]